MDQQTLWNDLFLDPVENPGSPRFANDSGIPFVDLDSDDATESSVWNSNSVNAGIHTESSVWNSNSVNAGIHVETERGHSWASPLVINERTEERQLEMTNMPLGSRTDTGQLENMNLNLKSNLADAGQSLSQNPSFIQNSVPSIPIQSGTANVLSSAVSSIPSGSSSSRVEGRPGSSFDCRRLSYKRKSIEPSGSSSGCLYRSENGLLQSNTALSSASSSNYPLGMNLSGEQPNPRIGTSGSMMFSDGQAYNVQERGESSQRNCRSRINPISNHWVPGNNLRSPDLWPSHQASNLLVPFDQSTEASNSQSRALPIPPVVQNTHPFPLIAAPPSSRASSSSRSAAIVENSTFVPPTGVRQQMQLSTINWSQIPPPSQAGTSSHAIQSSGPAWIPRQLPVRHPLIPPAGSGPGQTVNSGPLQSALPSSLQEMRHQSAVAAVRRLQQQYMSATGVQGGPESLRSAARENRRMLSEIRNAIHLAWRGEQTNLEDALFDHTVFHGSPVNFHDRHRDMRLDVDNMSYEELLALEERIGNVNTGLNEETVLKRLKQLKYISLETPIEVEPCCICQEEYVEEDDLGRLDCGHDFHTACIKQWLMLKNLCPICKTTGLIT